ncbi:chemotaxis protein CheB [Chitinophaga sp. XS-30]|uniref:chemotaxis protein CheB n=1 Tax=Chitinophaga sp. XS-30 TaxID=2604421 RepID=UPI0011DD2000|nr:chemotaxis protein CheB [Chitinophaga sp. XS-30]QEH41497.1 chemotaxis protein CheB [Chitinophaga sp. XS-30]
MSRPYDIITIGGSAGSVPVVMQLLEALPARLPVPVVIVLHRLRNVKSDMSKLLLPGRRLSEPEDKELLKENCIYLAPQNYHLILEADKSFMLDYSEPVSFSRPSITITFNSIAEVYGEKALGILLSGSNDDGAEGLCRIIAAGGTGVVLHPQATEFRIMPQSAIDRCSGVKIMTVPQMKDLILNNI